MGQARGVQRFGRWLQFACVSACWGWAAAFLLLAGCDPRWWEHGGGGSGQSSVCHCTPAGCNTLTVSNSAVQAHVNHGDALGECAPPPEAQVEGTWSGTIALSPYRPYTLTFTTRANGEVLGYVMGGTRHRTIIHGTIDGSLVSLTMLKVDSMKREEVTFTGTIDGDVFTGTSPGGEFTLVRDDRVLLEDNFVFLYELPNGETISIEMAVVTTETGEFVSGGFVTTPGQGCNPLACGGGITDFSLVGRELTMELETGGTALPCGGGTGTITGTFVELGEGGPNEGMFDSAFTFASCDGSNPRDGALRGLRAMGTDSVAIQQVLSAFGRLADDLEDIETPLGVPHPSFHSAYFHRGQDVAGLFDDYEAERAGRVDYTVGFSRFASLFTAEREYVFAPLVVPPRILYHQTRTSTAGGSPLDFDENSDAPFDAFKRLAEESGTWRFRGNDASTPPETGLPFGEPLECSTSDCAVVVVGAWGTHDGAGGALGGHPEGHQGFDIRFLGSAWLLAPHDGVIQRIDKPGSEATLFLRGTALETTFGHMDSESTCCGEGCALGRPDVIELCEHDMVYRGQRIGRAWLVPENGSAIYSRVHWDVRYVDVFEKNCPWTQLDTAGREQLANLAGAHPWSVWPTEPFLCNDVGRTAASFPRPLSTLWVRRNEVECSSSQSNCPPDRLRITRASSVAEQLYRFEDENGIYSSGAVCANGATLGFAPGADSCAMGSTVDTMIEFKPLGFSAQLNLTLGNGPMGTYEPEFE